MKKKRLNRGYKRGGKFRTHNVDETGEEVKKDKMGKVIEVKKGAARGIPSRKGTRVPSSSGKKNRKY